jgi:5'-3' exonuclease
MLTSLIDGDIIAYRCAASCQKQGVTIEPVEVALYRVDDLMRRIIHETSAGYFNTYLSGENNFRYKYNPEYKANRKDVVKPEWLGQCKQHLIDKWDASISEGCEADDSMAIAQTVLKDESSICTIDKDLLQVPGRHYNFVKSEFQYISPIEGVFNFYWQFIMGDKADNIVGFDGLSRQTVPKKFEGMYSEMQELASNEIDIFNYVRELYNDDERLLMNGICLWMQRETDQIWRFPTG